MKIAVISDTRKPTTPRNSHGLGRSAHDIASGLCKVGHDVTLFAGKGSQLIVNQVDKIDKVREYENEFVLANDVARTREFEAYLDTSHQHQLSKIRPKWPVVNRMADQECTWNPPNRVVNSGYMHDQYKPALLINTGIKSVHGSVKEPDDYVVFLSSHFRHKGYPAIRNVELPKGITLKVESNLSPEFMNRLLGSAIALLHPSTLDAAPRLPLEAAVLGVPTVCLRGDGCAWQVEHGVTGFACDSLDEFAEAINRCQELDRQVIRDCALANFNYDIMIEEYDLALVRVCKGDRW